MATKSRLPDFIGIGAMRCGTTWVTEQLRSHPQIHIPPHFKEVHYFDNHYERGIEWYLSNFSEASREQIIGEFTPSYIRESEVLERISSTCPMTKIIISVRHPMDRAFSHYNFLKNRKDISSSFYEALFDERFDILKAGLYGQQIENWLGSFPLDQIHIITFDEIRNSPGQVTSNLYGFLGVDRTHVPEGLSQKANVKHRVKSRLLAHTLRSAKHLIRPYISSRQGLRRLGLFKLGKVFNRLNAAPVEKIDIDQHAVTYLKEYYSEDIKLLNRIMNDRVARWK